MSEESDEKEGAQKAEASDPMIAKVELTAQDKGAPSPVPYSVFYTKPSPDIDTTGKNIIKVNLALKDLDCGLENLLPNECRPVLGLVRGLFRNGYYRFELTVGDWQLRVYKHPNNS